MPPADDRPTASLNGHPSADGTPTPPAGSTADLSRPSTAPHAAADFEAWATGATGGRYQRTEKHGSGGLGEVFKAEDAVLGRTVALKRLRADRHTPALRDRFLREARVTGRLEHPNIVPVYDLVESDDPVYAMRFLPGDTLADAARAYHARRAAGTATPLDLPRLLGAFVLVCEAVAYAHDRGVLHRDLKGQNILFGRFGEVCLADWGLAKRTDEPDRPGDPHPLDPPLDGATADGAVLGTPAFMAPELARGQKATVQTDVYALGGVLYQVLTGRGPHTGSNAEILSKLETGTPVKPVRELVPTVHPALDAVCRKALARDPAARYPTATALADEVRAYLAGEPVAAYPEPFAARAARWARRHRAGVLAAMVGLAVFAVVASVAAVLLWQANVLVERQRELAVEAKEESEREWERAEAERRNAEQARREAEEQQRAAVAAREQAERQRERAEGERRVAELAKSETERERDKYQAMLAVVRDYSDRLTDVVTEAETGMAAGARPVADRKKALERAVGAAEELVAATPDDPDLQARLARLLRYTATLARVRNDRATAEKSLAATGRILQGLIDRDPAAMWARRELALVRENQAGLKLTYGRPADAGVLLDRAADLLAGLPQAARDAADGRRAAAIVLLTRAEVANQLGRHVAAAAAAEQAADMFAGLSSAPDVRSPHDQVFRGLALLAAARGKYERGRYEGRAADALPAYDEAVDAFRAEDLPGAHPDMRYNHLRGLVERAKVRQDIGRPPAEVLPDLNAAVAGLRALAAADPGLPRYRQLLARGLAARGRAWAELAHEPAAVPAVRGVAAADSGEAVRLLEHLYGTNSERPDYLADLSAAWAAVAAAHTRRADVQRAYRRAGDAARWAIDRAGENTLHHRWLADLSKIAARGGYDVGKPKPAGR